MASIISEGRLWWADERLASLCLKATIVIPVPPLLGLSYQTTERGLKNAYRGQYWLVIADPITSHMAHPKLVHGSAERMPSILQSMAVCTNTREPQDVNTMKEATRLAHRSFPFSLRVRSRVRKI